MSFKLLATVFTASIMSSEDRNLWRAPYPEDAEIKTYKGSCHCGKFEFEFDYVDFSVRPPTVCNCSYCTTHGEMVVSVFTTLAGCILVC